MRGHKIITKESQESNREPLMLELLLAYIKADEKRYKNCDGLNSTNHISRFLKVPMGTANPQYLCTLPSIRPYVQYHDDYPCV